MAYDFSSVPNREGTNSLKWDNIVPVPGAPQAIPLWVADMDFAAPPAVQKALARRVSHGIYGYTNLPQAYLEEVASWNRRRYGRTWISGDFLAAPSVLHGMSMAIRAFTAPGDKILNFPPVYYPFYKVVRLNDRQIVDVPLVLRGRWEMDFEAIAACLESARRDRAPVKAVLVSAPQNPTGRVWTRDELSQLGELARAYDLLILSDEIHADLVLKGHRHLSPLDLPDLADRTIVFAGPNKTFNLAGLPISHIVTLDQKLRNRMKRAVEADFYDQPNVLSLTAAWAAYREGEPWLEELLAVIEANKAILDVFLERLNREWDLEPRLTSAPLEATYLAWVDVTALARRGNFSDDKDLGLFLEKVARVKMTTGSTFQTGGENHLRFNLATPKALLDEALDRIHRALA